MFKDSRARKDIAFWQRINETERHLLEAENEKLRRDINLLAEFLGIKFVDRSIIKKGDKK